MSFFRKHRRVTAFLFALTFVTVSAKGLCLMSAAAGGKGGAHDCCRKGWQTAPPGCCMDGGTGEAAAKVAARVVAPTPCVATIPPFAPTALSDLLVRQVVVNTHPDHAPPPITALRV